MLSTPSSGPGHIVTIPRGRGNRWVEEMEELKGGQRCKEALADFDRRDLVFRRKRQNGFVFLKTGHAPEQKKTIFESETL